MHRIYCGLVSVKIKNIVVVVLLVLLGFCVSKK